MDYKTHVFNAALEGNLMGLKVSLMISAVMGAILEHVTKIVLF